MVAGTLNNLFESRSIDTQSKNITTKELTFSKISLICSLKESEYDKTWGLENNNLEESLLFKNQTVNSGNIMNRSTLLVSE